MYFEIYEITKHPLGIWENSRNLGHIPPDSVHLFESKLYKVDRSISKHVIQIESNVGSRGVDYRTNGNIRVVTTISTCLYFPPVYGTTPTTTSHEKT
jgi:hypothetical protein